MAMDSEGRLRGLGVGGILSYSNTGVAKEVDWTLFLQAIAPDTTPVASSLSRWPPAFYADTRVAWMAVIDGESGNLPLWLMLAAATVQGGFVVPALYRFGLFTFVTMGIVQEILLSAPLTLDTSRWYFWRGLVPVAGVLALAIWGFKNVLGKQSLLPDGALEK